MYCSAAIDFILNWRRWDLIEIVINFVGYYKSMNSKKVNRFFINLCFLAIILISSSIISSGIQNQDVSIRFDISKYPIENTKTDIKIILINNENSSFNGSIKYYIYSDDLHWNEKTVDINVTPYGQTNYVFNIKPTYPGHYWISVGLYDLSSRQINTVSYPFNVHTYGETAVIAGGLFALISIIAYIFYNKK
jgi:hypothetical protein